MMLDRYQPFYFLHKLSDGRDGLNMKALLRDQFILLSFPAGI